MNSNIDNEIEDFPLVSVIIPCYNHAYYLQHAIESVIAQSYQNIEIIVIDDGSVDDTKQIALQYAQVKYYYQSNNGLAASRNAGIRHSKGKYLNFLDADDWLFPNAIEYNVIQLLKNKSLAFVSGSYQDYHEFINQIHEIKNIVSSDHYIKLLETNYISMIAVVLFQRWVFNEFQFSEDLRACEDYDLYLHITRKYPVLHHTNKIASYRKHSKNMSSDNRMMLNVILQVLKRQDKYLNSSEERLAYNKGIRYWRKYYCTEIVNNVRIKGDKLNIAVLSLLYKTVQNILCLIYGMYLLHLV